MKIQEARKSDYNKLNEYGKRCINGRDKIAKLKTKIDKLNQEIASIEDEINNALSSAHGLVEKEYPEFNSIITDKYKFELNEGQRVIVPKDTDCSKLPKQFVRIKFEPDKVAIKNEYNQKGKKLPKRLENFNISIEETITLNCSELEEDI